MPKTNSYLAMIVLAAVCLSCTFIKGKLSNDPLANIETRLPANMPPIDLNAPPLVSTGAEVMRQLAELDPQLEPLVRKFEDVELASLKKLFDEIRKESQGANYPEQLGSRIHGLRAPENAYKVSARSRLLMMQAGDFTTFTPASRAGAMGEVAMNITLAKVIFINGINRSGVNGGINTKPVVETRDGVTTTSGTTLILREDGTSIFGMETKTQSVDNRNKAVAEMTASIDGDQCPNAEGQLQITIKLRVGGEADGVGYSQDLTVFVRATVDDNADVATTTVDFTQGTRKVARGREIYVETGATYRYDGDGTGEGTQSNWRLIRHSQSAAEDRREAAQMAEAGQQSAVTVAVRVLDAARANWQNGGCVQIDAKAPGAVAASSSTQIPVKVTHKFGGAEVPSKLEAQLSGESSIDPMLIARTAGTLTYVAPGESGKSATIKLKAVSRRGRAERDLDANTSSGSYRIVGGLDYWKTDTAVCDISKPFKLTGGGFTMNLSGGMSGTYDYTGPYSAEGTGTYSITLPDGPGKAGTMVGSGGGSITGDKVYQGQGTEKYTLTPIPPCD